MIPRRSSLCFVLLALAGCGTSQGYQTPQVDIPAQWSEASQTGTSVDVAQSAWWKSFNDPELDSLIERAVKANLDVQLAAARVREARAQADISAAALSPSVTAKGSAVRERDSANAPVPVLIEPGGGIETRRGETENLFESGFDANWELDLFGGTRQAVSAAKAALGASVYDQGAAQLTLLGDVAKTYIELRGLQQQRAITRTIIANAEDMRHLVQARYVGGLTTDLDVARADAQLQSFSARLPPLDAAYWQGLHQLSLLLGEAPGALAKEFTADELIPEPSMDPPVGQPSDLLRQRPDIRSAERQVAASFARLQSAKADFYPKFSLGGSVGLASVSAGEFFNPASILWSIGPSITWPIFQGGKIVANIEVHDAQQQQALINYRKAILSGLTDVENAIVAYDRERDHRALLTKAVTAQQRTLNAARGLYQSGHTDFRDVLVSEQDLAQAQLDLTQSETAASVDAVALFKAIGGGWAAQTNDENAGQTSPAVAKGTSP